MSARENEAIARRWVEVWDQGDLAALDDLYAPDFVYHMRPAAGLEPGIAGEKQILGMLHTAFPDLRIIVEDVIVDEQSAVIRWTMPATHQGAFRGIEPNRKPVKFTGIDILQIKNGKVEARWDEVNTRAVPYV